MDFGAPARWLARHARWCLIGGLAAGIALPGLALTIRPWIPELVALLLFLTAFRIGPKAALGSLRDAGGTLGLVLLFQLALPLALVGFLVACEAGNSLPGLALVLMLSASPVSAGANITILLGRDPAPALRMLIAGTGLLPLTMLPVFWAMPGLGGTEDAVRAALSLVAVIGTAVCAAFLVRARFNPTLALDTVRALDGVSALVLAIVVVGLMSAVGPALFATPLAFLAWMAAAFAANFGLQITCWTGMRALGRTEGGAAVSVVAGNRNIALFLVALPAATTDPLLLWIGCYQLPMYLTPILMRWLYRRHEGGES